MQYKKDTICAISTPPGISGIAVIRVSGPEAITTVSSIFTGSRPLPECRAGKIYYGRIHSGSELVDEVIVTLYRAPRSYTGEDVVEISCHGNMFITNRIIELLLQKIRLATPGEFTQRAFFNDKMSLTQAEAVGDLLNAQTRYSHLAALQQLEGKLKHRIRRLLDRLTDYRILLELEIDFQEQGLDTLDSEKLQEDLAGLFRELQDLAATGSEGMILREGLRVSLVGAPNVGKSSIFNAFLETERAIVTPHPGTTRDYLEEAISLQGYLVRLFDTAGIRQALDQAEQLGIERSRQVIRDSHRVLFITDGNENRKELDQLYRMVPRERVIRVLNKADLFTGKQLTDYHNKGFVICSVVSPRGLDELKQVLLQGIAVSPTELESGLLSNTRQLAAVKKAVNAIEHARKSLQDNLGCEFTAFDLDQASKALEEVTGRITSEDILNRIFADFCIGK